MHSNRRLFIVRDRFNTSKPAHKPGFNENEEDEDMKISLQIGRKAASCCRTTQTLKADAPCVVGKCIVPI
jgi:hypothetical protein